jgi:phosphocarrier protein FPr
MKTPVAIPRRRPEPQEPSARRPGLRRQFVLLAPLTGPLVPLEQVPDPVFAGRMVGDGVAVDPESSCLLAPCDARVAHVHSAGHAVNLATDEGFEIVIHVGLDTVELKSEGFLPRVRPGDRVAAGDPLLEFAADYLALHARSLLTPVIVPASEHVLAIEARSGHVVAGRDPILVLTLGGPRGAEEEPASSGADVVLSEPVVVRTATGLHARPAAVVASGAKRFRCQVRLRRGHQAVNAKSVTALMSLEAVRGDALRVEAEGTGAAEAAAAVAALVASAVAEPERGAGVAVAGPREAPAPRAAERSGDPDLFVGVPASPGLAAGQIRRLHRDEAAVDETSHGSHEERQRLDQALSRARLELETLQARLRSEADPGKAAIFAAHAELLDDPDVLDVALEGLEEGRSAGAAWREAFTLHAERLAGSRTALLAARADDLRDVGRRVLRLLAGAEAAAAPRWPEGTILLAEDLSPSETATLDRTRVLGLCTVAGGATSHAAILARSLDLPAVAGLEARALDVADGTPAVLDGTRGTLHLRPGEDELRAVRERQDRRASRRRSDSAAALEPAVTRDGVRIAVAANAGSLAEAREAVALGAEGVGLLRTELLFMDRDHAPSEDEQYETYAAIAAALGPERPLVIRLLDVGGDKPLSYLPMPREDNPFLGVRGLRLLLDRPDILRAQARAVLRAGAGGRVSAMLPMVTTLAEWTAVRDVFEEERRRLGAAPVPLGLMIEVPAAALLAEAFAREAAFFSIGTNDLTQYTLAMDRGHPKLAPQVDGLHPAVLQLIALTARGAAGHGRWIGVCGGIASDREAVAILLGLGVTELSVSVPQVPAIKARVRELSLPDCRILAERALAATSAAEVRALVPELPED